MAMTLALTPEQAEILRKIVVKAKYTVLDVETALTRCPGAPDWDTIAPLEPDKSSMEDLTGGLLEKIGTVSPYHPFSFLLRLIEQKWALEEVRRGVAADMPSLVRPPRGIAGQVTALTVALTAMLDKLPATLTPGTIVEDPVFRRLCDVRPAIEAMVKSLSHFEAMKEAHDSLHMLQVMGAEWLDTVDEKDDDAAAPAITVPLLAPLSRITAVMTASIAKLPADLAKSCERCRDASTDADKRIRTGNPDEAAFACGALRAMLIREAPELDTAMFLVSRDFPLREFCNLFGDPLTREVAFDLGDTLRRRLMEHALWQATDLRLYAIEQTLAHPTDTLTADLMRLFPWTRSSLSTLLDPETAQRVVPQMNDVVVRYVLAADGQAPAGAAPATVKDICKAFSNLRGAARSAFLDVDQALKQDFARLATLQNLLNSLLIRVPRSCSLFLPP